MRFRNVVFGYVICVTATAMVQGQSADGQAWKAAPGPLATRWTKSVNPTNVHPEYPRPQMRREHWRNLNGLWQYAITPRGQERPAEFQGQILVPFPIESSLSGVAKSVGTDNELWYRREFSTDRPPSMGRDARLLLHFGAVDWRMSAWVNGREVGGHDGGYDPFVFDITDAIVEDADQELVIRVWDPTNDGYQPRGKQVKDPQGIWYTSVTGIWRTVWLEWVPTTSIARLRIRPDIDPPSIQIDIETRQGAAADKAWVEVLDGQQVVGRASGKFGEPLSVGIPDAKLWSPKSPFLYSLRVGIKTGDGGGDEVASYVGLREISVSPDGAGRLRLCLNHEPLFQLGPLDQGWWPDGLYTAPSDEGLRYDLEMTRKLGFNMIRKHVKVEPDRWYHHCDQLGLLVWQDMPNGDQHIRPEDGDFERSAESEANFRREWAAIINALENHPCIVAWVPFNEGWGQFKTNEILAWTKERDPTRLVDGPSGWTDRGAGDMHDMHRYPGPAMPDLDAKRAVVLGEFGGLGLPIADHLWWNKRNWGYRTYTTREELQTNYEDLIRQLKPLVQRGLAAAIYTQTTDVEGEVNGFMTYDREIVKLDVERVARLHAQLHEPSDSGNVR